jgi:hypothetical protein
MRAAISEHQMKRLQTRSPRDGPPRPRGRQAWRPHAGGAGDVERVQAPAAGGDAGREGAPRCSHRRPGPAAAASWSSRGPPRVARGPDRVWPVRRTNPRSTPRHRTGSGRTWPAAPARRPLTRCAKLLTRIWFTSRNFPCVAWVAQSLALRRDGPIAAFRRSSSVAPTSATRG